MIHKCGFPPRHIGFCSVFRSQADRRAILKSLQAGSAKPHPDISVARKGRTVVVCRGRPHVPASISAGTGYGQGQPPSCGLRQEFSVQILLWV